MQWRYRRRGERDMVREVAVVVLGVLLALGAEQLVSTLHWRADVAQTRAAIDLEIAGMVYQGYERIAIAPCLSARILELSGKLRSGGDRWTAAPLRLKLTAGIENMGKVLPVAVRSPARVWTTDAWKMGIADGTVARLPRADATRYSQAYYTIDNLRQMQDAESGLISDLSVLALDQALDTGSRIAFQRDLAGLDQINGFSGLLAQQLREALGARNAALRDPALVADYRDTIAKQRQFRGDCVRTDVNPLKG